MRFLIIFLFLLTNSFASEVPDIKNLIINKEYKKYDSLTFLDAKNQKLNLDSYKGNLIILNFWATWCAPCKEEMPSLDILLENSKLSNLKIFPINVGKDSLEKSELFFRDLNIKNLEVYFDFSINFSKKIVIKRNTNFNSFQ